MEKSYTISRFEEQGDSLFICLNSTNNPVYLEHFFNESEKLDLEGTIAKLVAELELMDEAYVAPLPRINKLEEAQALKIESIDIQKAKTVIVAEKIQIEATRLQAIENVKLVEEPLEIIEE